MFRDITKECVTVTRDGDSILFWKGIVLCATEYEEQPYEIEGMLVSLELMENGSVEVDVKTPVDETIFDYYCAFVFKTLSELERFEKMPFDPLFRGYYPLLSKLENASLIDISDSLSNKRNRVYLDANVMATIMADYFELNSKFPVGNQLEKLIEIAFMEKWQHLLDIKGHQSNQIKNVDFEVMKGRYQARIEQDVFGEIIVIGYKTVNFKATLKLTKHLDVLSNNIVLAINNIPFDELEYTGGYYKSGFGVALPTDFVMKTNEQRIINMIIELSRDSEANSGVLIDSNRYNSTLKMNNYYKMISNQKTSVSSISEFGTFDYENYLGIAG